MLLHMHADVLLCKARNAPKSVLDVGDKVKKAIQLRDGTAAKRRSESGHHVDISAAEHASIIRCVDRSLSSAVAPRAS